MAHRVEWDSTIRGDYVGIHTREVGAAVNTIKTDAFAVTHEAVVEKTYEKAKAIFVTPVDIDLRLAVGDDEDVDVEVDLPAGKWQKVVANLSWPVGVYRDAQDITIKVRGDVEGDSGNVCVWIIR